MEKYGGGFAYVVSDPDQLVWISQQHINLQCEVMGVSTSRPIWNILKERKITSTKKRQLDRLTKQNQEPYLGTDLENVSGSIMNLGIKSSGYNSWSSFLW